MQKSEFPNMRHYVGFSQIGSHLSSQVFCVQDDNNYLYRNTLIERSHISSCFLTIISKVHSCVCLLLLIGTECIQSGDHRHGASPISGP